MSASRDAHCLVGFSVKSARKRERICRHDRDLQTVSGIKLTPLTGLNRTQNSLYNDDTLWDQVVIIIIAWFCSGATLVYRPPAMPRAAVTVNSYGRDSRPRHCSRADIPAWRPQKSHYCIIIVASHIIWYIQKSPLKMKKCNLNMFCVINQRATQHHVDVVIAYKLFFVQIYVFY